MHIIRVIMLVLVTAAAPAVAQETICTDSDNATAEAARSQAKQALETFVRYADSGDASVLAPIEKWFGNSEQETVAAITDTLRSTLTFIDAFGFRCVYVNDGSFVGLIEDETGQEVLVDGIGSTYAYVYPDNSFTIYLLRLFFESGDTGANSKAGTIIHEGTHFTLTGNTGDDKDHYGVDGSLALAQSDPQTALQTADNYQYLIEDWLYQI